MSEVTTKPNPGSHAAYELGCKCPISDNGYGRGAHADSAGRPVFWYEPGCPVHTDEGGEDE